MHWKKWCRIYFQIVFTQKLLVWSETLYSAADMEDKNNNLHVFAHVHGNTWCLWRVWESYLNNVCEYSDDHRGTEAGRWRMRLSWWWWWWWCAITHLTSAVHAAAHRAWIDQDSAALTGCVPFGKGDDGEITAPNIPARARARASCRCHRSRAADGNRRVSGRPSCCHVLLWTFISLITNNKYDGTFISFHSN